MAVDLSVRGLINGALDLGDTLNFMTTSMDEKKEEMIDILLESGFTKDNILDLIDVVRDQANEYIDKRIEYAAWAAKEAAKKTKPRTARKPS